jgi:hypothetical protein
MELSTVHLTGGSPGLLPNDWPFWRSCGHRWSRGTVVAVAVAVQLATRLHCIHGQGKAELSLLWD